MSPAPHSRQTFDLTAAEGLVGEMKAFALLMHETTERGGDLSSDRRGAVFVLACIMAEHVNKLDKLIQDATGG